MYFVMHVSEVIVDDEQMKALSEILQHVLSVDIRYSGEVKARKHVGDAGVTFKPVRADIVADVMMQLSNQD